MAIDSDSPISLPTPPPPRLAPRREAIDAALRKFDGVEDAPAKPPARPWWASHQRQVGALATAAIIAVVSIPVALTVLKDQPRPPVARDIVPVTARPKVQYAPPVSAEPRVEQADEMAAADVPRSKLPLEPHETAPTAEKVDQKAANEAVAPLPAVAAPAAPPAPPPPPPPAPPPAPAPERGYAANEASDANIVISGSRIRQVEEPSSQHGALAAKRAADASKDISPGEAYAKFLPRLQGAVRSGNRRAVTALIQYPLRVNFSSGARTYPNRSSVESDFDRIFTPRVRSAILAQRADSLFVRDQGAMIGEGEVWFDQTCRNSDCSMIGPVLIKAINP